MTPEALVVRDSTAADLPRIAEIYGWNVLHGTGTFELDPPSAADMAERRDAVLALRLPWLVAEQAGHVIGYAYANQFRPRPAYRFCAEDSIYLASEARGRGAGKALLAALLSRCEAAGIRQIVAVIGDSRNAASIGLHAALGFTHIGLLRSSGRKFDRWLDTVMMQRALGGGDSTPPPERVLT